MAERREAVAIPQSINSGRDGASIEPRRCLSGILRLAVLFCAVTVAGCSLFEAGKQARLIEQRSVIEGTVQMKVSTAPTYVLLFEYSDGAYEFVNRYTLNGSGAFRFHVAAGQFVVGAFVDTNGDGVYQSDEPAQYLRAADDYAPKLIQVEPGTRQELRPLSITAPLDVSGAGRFDPNDRDGNLGQRVSLDHPMFSRESASMGLWRPIDYAQRQWGGLMRLDPYSPDKLPVVLIHGIEGSARDFRPVIDTLDRSRFQVWVLQYPSGLPLELVSDYLSNGLNTLQAKFGFDEVVIVAHSMGGLVARDFAQSHACSRSGFRLPLVVTIASPLHGLESAGAGVRNSPLVVPVWRDLDPASTFIRALHARPWPAETRYGLAFTYIDGEGGDGVVPLHSQLSQDLQDEATQLRGFRAGHVEVLADEAFLRWLNESVLDDLGESASAEPGASASTSTWTPPDCPQAG